MASQLKVSQLWSLERYARLLQGGREQLLPQTQPGRAKAGSSWKNYHSTVDNTIKMSLLEGNHLMVSCGSQIYESISLWDAKKWMKGFTKEDSALFVYKINGENRRFKVQFSPLPSGGTAADACKNFSSALSPLVLMKDFLPSAPSQSQQPMDTSSSQLSFSQRTQSDEQLPPLPDIPGSSASLPNSSATQPVAAAASSGKAMGKQRQIPVSEIAKLVRGRGKSLGEAYASTNFPKEQLGSFIRLCLTDANFPAFVEAVEKELDTLTK